MKKIIALGAVLGGVPMVSFAAETTAWSILGVIGGILGYIMPILITLAAVWFVYNVIMYMISGDEAKKKDAKKGMISGLIGLFIVIAFWGILRIFMKTFNIGTTIGQDDIVPYVPIAPDAYQGGANQP